MRDYDEIKNDIETLDEEIKPIEKQYHDYISKRGELKRELEECIVENKLYHSMSDLKKYTDMEIKYIKLVVLNKDDNKQSVLELYGGYDDNLEIENGYLNYSSYDNGIYKWVEGNTYKYMYCFDETIFEFLGYIDIRI